MILIKTGLVVVHLSVCMSCPAEMSFFPVLADRDLHPNDVIMCVCRPDEGRHEFDVCDRGLGIMIIESESPFGIFFFCKKRLVVPTDGAKLLIQFPAW